MQFFRYFFVGGSSAVVHLSVFYVCMQTVLSEEQYLLANLIAFVAGVTWNHTLGVLWVFQSKRHWGKEFLMVLTVAAFGLLWNSILLYFFVEYGGLHPFIANLFAIAIVMFWNFGMRKFVIFR